MNVNQFIRQKMTVFKLLVTLAYLLTDKNNKEQKYKSHRELIRLYWLNNN